MIHDAQLVQKLSKIRLAVFDVDGTLTSGGLILGENDEYKQYDVQDGAGLVFLQQAGVEVAVISGRSSRSLERRCKELNIKEMHQGVKDKRAVFEDLLKRKGISASETAVMGDDLPDLPLMLRAGVSVAPANATREVRIRANVVTHARGGEGAAREFAEILLKAKNAWHDIVESYLE